MTDSYFETLLVSHMEKKQRKKGECLKIIIGGEFSIDSLNITVTRRLDISKVCNLH